jgi:NAD(P)-dependent dehydrogenase (short-subunit alcohol dehydrogenase family)
MFVDGKVVMIVGAGPGLGATLVRRCAEDGADLVLAARRRSLDAGGYGTLVTCRYVAPYMVEAGTGAIVNVTSMTSRLAHGGRSDYAAGKAAMHRLGWALADELGPLGIRVNAVAPCAILGEGVRGWIEGNAHKRGVSFAEQLAAQTGEMALRRIATEDEVANAILFLASDFASGITGATLDVNAGQLFQ